MNYIIGGAALLFGAAYLWFTQDIRVPTFGGPINGRVFPIILGVALVLVAATMFIPKKASATPAEPVEEEPSDPVDYFVLFATVGWTIAYYLVLEPIGFILATIVYLYGLLLYFHRGRRITNIVVAIAFPVISYLVFSKLLGLVLPRGFLHIG